MSVIQRPHEEFVYFENWRDLGCQVIVNGKEVLTLNTPESSLGAGGSPVFVEDWITPEEFCENLAAVLRAFGASEAVLDQVEWERQGYVKRQVERPTRTAAHLLSEIELAVMEGTATN